MKTVRFIQGMGEPRGPGIRPTETRKVSDEEAERLIERGIAVEYTKDDKATQATIKGIKQADDEGFEQIVSAVMDEGSRRGRATEVPAVEANLVKDASDEDLVELSQNVTAELAERELSVPVAATASAVEVPDGVVPGETPGWPIVNGVVIDLPVEVREELASNEIAIELREGGATGVIQTEEEAEVTERKDKESAADKAAAETSKGGSKGTTATSAKASRAEKRGG